MADFSVIIPHHNDVMRLTRCLEVLMPQVTAEVEVIVADNASTESLAAVRKRWPKVQIVVQPEKGAGPARNAGAMASNGQWLIFIDADCVAAPDWLEQCKLTAEKGVVFGGQVSLFHETMPPMSGSEAFEAIFAFNVPSYLKNGFLPSCQLVMARSDFELVGGFRSEISEDVDWSRRARAAGLVLRLSSGLNIEHPTRSNWPQLVKKWRRLTKESYCLDGKEARFRWAAKALMMPASILFHMPRVLVHRELSTSERLRAFSTLVRLRSLRMFWMLKQATSGRP